MKSPVSFFVTMNIELPEEKKVLSPSDRLHIKRRVHKVLDENELCPDDYGHMAGKFKDGVFIPELNVFDLANKTNHENLVNDVLTRISADLDKGNTARFKEVLARIPAFLLTDYLNDK